MATGICSAEQGAILSNSHDMLNYVTAIINEALPAFRIPHRQSFVNNDGAFGLRWQIAGNTLSGTRVWKSGGVLGFRT